MASPRHLRRAPIVEALIDLRVPSKPSVTPDLFADLAPLLKDRYPVVEPQLVKEATVRIEGGKLTTSTTAVGIQGLRFKSADGFTLVQMRSDGFTLNRLRPYTKWTELFPEFMALWPSYVERAQPSQITRIALRYINELQLPIEHGEDFSEFLTAPPTIPSELPQLMNAFLSRIIIHHEAKDVFAIVTQSLGTRPAADQGVPMVLDIDVSQNGNLSVDPKPLAEAFEVLHGFKNDVFFSFLTDRTLRLCE